MNSTNYEVPHCEAFSTPHSRPSWAQIFTSGSCFQIHVRDHASQPYSTTVLYILIFKSLEVSDRKHRIEETFCQLCRFCSKLHDDC